MSASADLPSPFLDEDGYIDDESANRYLEAVMERFSASPEGVEVWEASGGLGWATAALEYGMRYEGVDLMGMRAGDLEKILIYLFPRKVSCAPDEATEILEELVAFWRFADRELRPPHAAECLALLESPGFAGHIERELADPANWGMAKSFVMQGRHAGFDMASREGLTAFQALHNLAALPDLEQRDTGRRVIRPSADAKKAKRRKRREQKRSRRRNR